MEQWHGKVAVVTGASSGIGAAITKDLVRSGLIVIGLARRTERIEKLKSELSESTGGQLHSFFCDVSSIDSIKTAFAWVEEHFQKIHILVNNAGIVKPINILTEKDDCEVFKQIIDTNLTGLVCCTKTAFKMMQHHMENAHIVNINSIFGHVVRRIGPDVRQNVYPSTKHGITALNEVLRLELNAMRNAKIKISSVSPGLVRTEIINTGNFPADEYFARMPHLNAEDVARGVMYALSEPPHVHIQEIIIRPVGEMI